MTAIFGTDLGPLLDYDGKMLVCRADGHDWPVGGPSDHWWEDVDESGRQVGWWRELVCRRCKSRRYSTMDRYGYVRSRIRGRPKDYRVPRDSGVSAQRYARLARVVRQAGPRVMPRSVSGDGSGPGSLRVVS